MSHYCYKGIKYEDNPYSIIPGRIILELEAYFSEQVTLCAKVYPL